MPNELTFSAPITVPDFTKARMAKASEVHTADKRLVLDIELYGEDGWRFMYPLKILVTNGACTRVRVNPNGNMVDVLSTETVTAAELPGLVQAFDQVMGAYFSGGGDTAVLAKLAELGLLPPGTAA